MRKIFTLFFAIISLCTVSLSAQTTLWPLTADDIKVSTFDTATIYNATTAAPNPPAGFKGWVSKPTKAAVTTALDQTQWIWTKTLVSRGAYGGGRPLVSPTASNGVAIFDSDFLDSSGDPAKEGLGISPANHAAELISPVMNMAGKSDLIVEFNQIFTNYISGTYMAYSSDGGTNWSKLYRLNQDVIQNSSTLRPVLPTSFDSTKVRVFLSGSTGSANFRIKFVFDGPPTASGLPVASGGNYYFWMIDDVKIVDDKYVDLRVDPFYALPPSLFTPKEHLEPIRFLADIRNQGTLSVPNVKLTTKVWRMRDTALIFTSTSSEFPTTFKADTTFENRILPDSIRPANLPVGRYVGSYRVSADNSNVDINPSNDTIRFTFWVSDTSNANSIITASGKFNFTKEAVASNPIISRSASGLWMGNEPRSWRIGNYFRTVSSNATFTSLFAFIEAKAAVGRRIQASIYEYKESDNDIEGILPSERTLVAAADTLINARDQRPYSVTNPDAKSYVFKLIDINTGKNFYPKANTDYLAMIEFDGPALPSYVDSNYIRAGYTQNQDYSAMRYLTELLGAPRFSYIVGKKADDEWATLAGANSALTPIIRLNALPFRLTSTPEVLSDNNKLELSPNPVSNGDYLNVNVGLEKTSDMLLRVMSLDGRLVAEQIFEKYSAGQIKVDINNYASGTYILQIATPEGILSKKFVVIK
jgi:hypothetical protein